ncbi:MAG: AAA family ATPase [Calditerrivibrio sp.]|nr:AAA family ATPase [Calditerrivibrio sp.]
MYNKFFGFQEEPFKLSPDPEYFYLSSSHENAIELMKYGIESRKGFITLVGEVGTGKSTLIRYLLRDLSNMPTSLIINPFLSPDELLYSIAKDFGIKTDLCINKGDVYSELTHFLINNYKNGKNAAIIIDEAQNLTFESFEVVRQISNIELENEKLVQIVLAGQTELENCLLKQELRQLNQRVSIRIKLSNFDFNDTENYIIHRINVAAKIRKYIFNASAIKEIHRLTKGNPREINQLCDKSLLIAYSQNLKKIDPSIVRRAAKEYYISENNKPKRKFFMFSFITAGIFVVLYLFWSLYGQKVQDAYANHNNISKNDNVSSEKGNMLVKSDNNSNIIQNNTVEADNSSKVKDICIKINKNINFRKIPSFNGDILKVLNVNEKYNIIDEDIASDWLKIRVGEDVGYVFNDPNLLNKEECKADE